MKKYVVSRDNVYIGRLIQPIDLSVSKYEQKYHRLKEEEKLRIKKLDLNICSKDTIRPILFSITENKLAHDLMYDINFDYPILEIKRHKIIQSEYIVEKITKIEELLSYLEYPNLLTKKDIKKIYKKLILSSKWLEENRSLFGYIEVLEEAYINCGSYQISPEIYDELQKFKNMYQKTPSKQELHLIKELKHN